VSGKPYCNCLAQARGLDPGGHAHGFKDAIVVETPLPWRFDMMQKAGPLPQEVIDLLGVWLQEFKDGKGYSHLPLAIAPDPEYSRCRLDTIGAYVEREQAKQIIERRGDVRPLCGHYRGWAGLDGGFMQALERQLWLEHGWDWFTFAKAGEIVNQERSADPRWAQACLRYMTPSDTAERSLESRVEISHRINTEHATALDEKLNYAQYQVARKEKYLDPAIQREL